MDYFAHRNLDNHGNNSPIFLATSQNKHATHVTELATIAVILGVVWMRDLKDTITYPPNNTPPK